MNADRPSPKVLLANKGHDADFIREDKEKRSGFAIIPTKRNQLVQLLVDTAIYALRNMVERFVSTNSRTLESSRPDTIRPPSATSASSTSSHSACGCANLSTPPTSSLPTYF
jgi:hypothetical protein